MDPKVEPELDTFSLFFPLPYRVAVILVLGVWAWALNLHYLSLLKIDVASLIRYPNRTTSTGPSHYLRTYRLATIISAPLIASILLFWSMTRGKPSAVIAWDILPQSYLFLLTILFILPLQKASKAGRYRFLSTLKRISLGGLAEADNGKFGDILLADALTSYAKVLADLFVSGCMFISKNYSSTAKPDRKCGGTLIVPLILSIPSIIRLRQCLIEFLRVRRGHGHPGSPKSSGWGGQHLANALKYSTAFPVIILGALQRDYDPEKIGMSESGLFRLWLLCVIVQSMYSFYWDVAKDWDLTLFSSKERNSSDHPWGLRRHTHIHSKEAYYCVIITDFVLRCTWSLKLSPHLDRLNDLEEGIFAMELLEVLRRWMWVFFRVEAEHVRTMRGPTQESIPLVSYLSDHDKMDD